MNRFASVVVIVATLGVFACSADPAFSQRSPIQQVTGDFVGLAPTADGGSPLAVHLTIDQQDGRFFSGTLSYMEQDNLIRSLLPYIEQDNVTIFGAITPSGWCGMIAHADEETAALSLDWQKFGGGAAALTGEIVKGSAPVVFLRPFDNLGVSWKNGTARGSFQSEISGLSVGSAMTFRNGGDGSFNASFSLGREEFEVIGSSSTDSEVVVVGASGSLVITITGQVQIDARTGATTVNGSYQIKGASGIVVDSGIIAILIG